MLCTLKAHQAVDCAGGIATLLGPATAVVVAMNGIPWWYFHRHGGPHEGQSLDLVHPGAVQWRVIGPERAIGCVVDPACEVVAPGHRTPRFPSLHPGRAGWRADAEGRGAERGPGRGRVRRADPRRDLLERLGSAAWQRRLQPGQRADRGAARPDRRRARPVRPLSHRDGRGRCGRPGVRSRDPGRYDRSPAGGGGRRHRPQDVDAAGPGAWPVDGDRRAGHRGPGNGSPRRGDHAVHRSAARPRPGARAPGRALQIRRNAELSRRVYHVTRAFARYSAPSPPLEPVRLC